MFGPDVVRSRLDAVSHHSTEKYVKRHEFFEKKKKKKNKDDEKNHLGAH